MPTRHRARMSGRNGTSWNCDRGPRSTEPAERRGTDTDRTPGCGRIEELAQHFCWTRRMLRDRVSRSSKSWPAPLVSWSEKRRRDAGSASRVPAIFQQGGLAYRRGGSSASDELDCEVHSGEDREKPRSKESDPVTSPKSAFVNSKIGPWRRAGAREGGWRTRFRKVFCAARDGLDRRGSRGGVLK